MMSVFALSRKGALISQKIARIYPSCRAHVLSKYSQEYPEFLGMNCLSQAVESCWQEQKHLIFVMAAGIVVRTIAPLIDNKAKDPAVLVVDEDGRYVISLLSGHLGGANRLAADLASSLGAQPVITTATDLAGIPALDEIAGRYKYYLENMKDWKQLAAAIMNGEKAVLISSVSFRPKFPDNVDVFSSTPENSLEYKGIMYITERVLSAYPEPGVPYVILRPKNLIIGLGCRRGKPVTDILRVIKDAFCDAGLSLSSAAALATIDIKRDETGILEAAEELGIPLRFYSADKLSAYSGNFEESDFVKSRVGTGAVAEPAACLTAEKPSVLVKKTAHDGITVAIVKDLAMEIR